MAGESEEFPSREEAEDWLGAHFEVLLSRGILAATLMEAERELYTMKLTPE